MRNEAHQLVAAVLAVADSDPEDDGERARSLAVLEERMESWFRAKGWVAPAQHEGQMEQGEDSTPPEERQVH